MSQHNRITTHCLPSRWWSGVLLQAVTGAPLVWVQFIRGRHPVAAGGERLVSSTESSRRQWIILWISRITENTRLTTKSNAFSEQWKMTDGITCYGIFAQ